jgi:hypothetical protein
MLAAVLEATDPNLVEAISLLRDRHMEQCRRPGRKDDAGKRLFAQLRALSGRYDLEVNERHPGHWNDLVVHLPPDRLRVSCMGDDGVWVARLGEQGGGTEVMLDYDRDGECFVGREPDRFRTPVPGEPIQRRPAIVVLMETIIAVSRQATR